MTAKDSIGSEEAQASLPFGALPDTVGPSGGSGVRKASKKTASKKAASKKTASKKTASKKTASKKTVARKPAAAKEPVAEVELEPTGADPEGSNAKSAPVRKKAASAKKVAKKKVTRRTAANDEDEAPKGSSSSTALAGDLEGVSASDSGGTSRSAKKTVRKKSVRASAAGDDTAEATASVPESSTASAGASEASIPSGRKGGDGIEVSVPEGSEDRGSRSLGGEAMDEEGGPRRRRTRRGRRKRRNADGTEEVAAGEGGEAQRAASDRPHGDAPSAAPQGSAQEPRGQDDDRPRRRRRRRGRRGKNFDDAPDSGTESAPADADVRPQGEPREPREPRAPRGQKGKRDARPDRASRGARDADEPRQNQPATGKGLFLLDKGQVSVLRQRDHQWLPSKGDIYVPKKLVQQYKLRDGMIVEGRLGRGFKHKFQLDTVDTIDGKEPLYWKNKPLFKDLTSIDPDFHYAVGDITDDVSMRMIDLLAPIGRGQRGLLVAPPRSGKTTLMRQFAAGIEKGYPDVHLLVLLIDERPEEATEWQRSLTTGEVFVSTADETAKHHISVAEVVWRRAMRLVEMGEDVIVLLDSITRLARAYNNQAGSGRTMSGGLDSRAMEQPRKIFGSARNTVEAGSLTILGTTLVDTGSRMDQMVFEEFKGTGNMELVLNRKLADRRIFPAIDIEKTGTRKEEKLIGLRRLKLIHVLRRVLSRMHFAEAADLLITRLSDVAKTDDFLERFSVDPEA